jgi:HEAT repeat protein
LGRPLIRTPYDSHREIAMRKRWPLAIVLVIVILVAVAWIFPTTIYWLVGSLRGEATFDGKPTDYWVHALNQEGFLGHKPPAGDAGKTLKEGGAAAVPVLSEIARGPDDNLRQQALNALSLMGPDAKGAKPVLQETIKNEKDRSRFLFASKALCNSDPAAAAEALCAVLREEKGENLIRQACAFTALMDLAPQGQEAVPLLKEIADDPKKESVLRVQAINVLFRMKQPVEPLVHALCEIVCTDKTPVGVQALEVLQEMGPQAKPAVATLVKLLNDPKVKLTGPRWGPPHRAAVIRTLGDIGPEATSAMPVLISCLQSNNYFIRTEVATALARMGPVGKQAITARNAVWGASLTLLAARSPNNIAIPGLVQIEKRTWIPLTEGHSAMEIHEAVEEMDPGAARRAGLPGR